MDYFKNRKIVLITLFLVGVAYIIYTAESGLFFRDKFEKDILLTIEGKVIEKYVDESNHMHQTCVIEKGNENFRFIFDNDKSEMFEYIEVGDSIYKASGDSLFFIMRNGHSKNFYLEY